jgi:hypothetical protein
VYLTDSQKEELKRLSNEGKSYPELMSLFNISHSSVSIHCQKRSYLPKAKITLGVNPPHGEHKRDMGRANALMTELPDVKKNNYRFKYGTIILDRTDKHLYVQVSHDENYPNWVMVHSKKSIFKKLLGIFFK